MAESKTSETEGFSLLARVVDSVGSPAFLDLLSTLVSNWMGTEKRLVIRYSTFSAPLFEINSFMSNASIALYLEGLWRIDPLHRLSRNLARPQVVRLRARNIAGAGGGDYLEEVFKLAFVFDELAFLLPVPGGATLAICCDRQDSAFSEEDQASAEAILPLIAALHRRHLIDVVALAASGAGTLDNAVGRERAVSILDFAGQSVYVSPAWQSLVGNDRLLASRIASAKKQGGEPLSLPEGRVLHIAPLDPMMSAVPDGAIAMIETDASDPIKLSMLGAAMRFCERRGLTPREADIVKLTLRGYPNSEIARRLKLSPGTVKNHRWRLYNKLDITTERELFLEFLSDLLNRPVSEMAKEN